MKKEKTISTCICLVMIFSYLLFLICFWNKIPDSIPVHFDAAGIADRYGSKGSLVFDPILGLMLLGLFALIENFPQSWNLPVPKDAENQDKISRIVIHMFTILKILSVLISLYAGICSIKVNMPVWPVYLIMILLFGTVGIGIFDIIKLAAKKTV